MPLVIAAIRTGHDPVGKLPEAAFHRTLETQLNCPKCDATYNLVVDYDASIGRFFEEESRRPIMMLRKAIMQGHSDGHRVPHFETAGVVVTSFSPPRNPLAEKEAADKSAVRN
jgi:hypothetical protein